VSDIVVRAEGVSVEKQIAGDHATARAGHDSNLERPVHRQPRMAQMPADSSLQSHLGVGRNVPDVGGPAGNDVDTEWSVADDPAKTLLVSKDHSRLERYLIAPIGRAVEGRGRAVGELLCEFAKRRRTRDAECDGEFVGARLLALRREPGVAIGLSGLRAGVYMSCPISRRPARHEVDRTVHSAPLMKRRDHHGASPPS